ncbi:hypothetical protein AMTR_s00005p00197620, partial [Amborella trichopoda]
MVSTHCNPNLLDSSLPAHKPVVRTHYVSNSFGSSTSARKLLVKTHCGPNSLSSSPPGHKPA